MLIRTIILCLIALGANAQTNFQKTAEQFSNGEFVYNVSHNGSIVGEFWPITGLDLITNQTHNDLFQMPLVQAHQTMGSIATTPDGMTTYTQAGDYVMEGMALAHGEPCGDGTIRDYGIVYTVNNQVTFTHKREVADFDQLYTTVKEAQGSLFFLPSIFRNGGKLNSTNLIDNVLVRRETYAGIQMGVVMFTASVTVNDAITIITGLDRSGGSTTTHIYVLDGGPTWGQSSKKVNGKVKTIGTADPSVLTNHLVFY